MCYWEWLGFLASILKAICESTTYESNIKEGYLKDTKTILLNSLLSNENSNSDQIMLQFNINNFEIRHE
jgi:hypothetical protein